MLNLCNSVVIQWREKERSGRDLISLQKQTTLFWTITLLIGSVLNDLLLRFCNTIIIQYKVEWIQAFVYIITNLYLDECVTKKESYIF